MNMEIWNNLNYHESETHLQQGNSETQWIIMNLKHMSSYFLHKTAKQTSDSDEFQIQICKTRNSDTRLKYETIWNNMKFRSLYAIVVFYACYINYLINKYISMKFLKRIYTYMQIILYLHVFSIYNESVGMSKVRSSCFPVLSRHMWKSWPTFLHARVWPFPR